MTQRFEAEEILRAAASGAIPGPNQVLVRRDLDKSGHSGWVFGVLDIGELDGEVDGDQIDSIPFEKITGVAARGQLPNAIAYEDEPNEFTERQTIPDLVAVNFEALVRFVSNG